MTKKTSKSTTNAPASVSVANCNFVGVEFSAEACSTITAIARALEQNAKGLSCLAETIRANNIHIDSMVRVDPSGAKVD